MIKGLVSIITPCYNSASFVYRLLDSILDQDYQSIEMFAVDDGSTDDTQNCIKSYIKRFEDRGFRLTYIYQENSGQSEAINKGLKLMNGEFFIWPDSDDYFRTSKAISTMVNVLKQSGDEYGMARCRCQFVEEGSLREIGAGFNYTDSEELFIPFLLGLEFRGGAGLYMVKVDAFDKAIRGRDIYVNRVGQNCQLLLPLFYFFKCVTIQVKLLNILVRKKSHSRFVKSYEGQLNDITGFIDVYTNTLSRISCADEEKQRYAKIVKIEYAKGKAQLALHFGKYEDAKKFVEEIKELGGTISNNLRIKLFLSHFPIILKASIWLSGIIRTYLFCCFFI